VNVTEYNGSSVYQAIQFQATKRFAKALSLMAGYTYSHERERTQRLNPQDEELTKQVSPTSRPHRFTFSAIYELPIGRGRAIGTDWNRWLDAFVGGWQIQTNYERQTGVPIILGNVYFEGNPYLLRNRIGEKNELGQRYGIDIPGWDLSGFYPGGVVNTGAAAIGVGNNNDLTSTNTLRYFPLALDNFRQQRFLNFNAGMSKNFRIREGMRFQLRIEAINALNNPYFNDPNVTPNNANFGRTTGQRQPPRDFQIGGRFTF
jgi:hypothetical protein